MNQYKYDSDDNEVVLKKSNTYCESLKAGRKILWDYHIQCKLIYLSRKNSFNKLPKEIKYRWGIF